MMPFPGPGSSKKCLFPATEQGKVIKDTVPPGAEAVYWSVGGIAPFRGACRKVGT
jgi:hypothetical protein